MCGTKNCLCSAYQVYYNDKCYLGPLACKNKANHKQKHVYEPKDKGVKVNKRLEESETKKEKKEEKEQKDKKRKKTAEKRPKKQKTKKAKRVKKEKQTKKNTKKSPEEQKAKNEEEEM